MAHQTPSPSYIDITCDAAEDRSGGPPQSQQTVHETDRSGGPSESLHAAHDSVWDNGADLILRTHPHIHQREEAQATDETPELHSCPQREEAQSLSPRPLQAGWESSLLK